LANLLGKLNLLYTAIISYFIGSIPFAFIFTKLFLKRDIRYEGTGNVGAMNTYDISGMKGLAITVGVLDALKGTAAVLLAWYLFPELTASGSDAILKEGAILFDTAAVQNSRMQIASMATFFVVFGHCYPVWLKFHGGRGLATVLGATLLFVMSIPISWLVVWVMSWFYSKKIHFCNISATIGMVCIAPLFESLQTLVLILSLAALVLIRHGDVMKETFRA
jgi:acyl phosphate:glycerol-3-phosphate acyltransferase